MCVLPVSGFLYGTQRAQMSTQEQSNCYSPPGSYAYSTIAVISWKFSNKNLFITCVKICTHCFCVWPVFSLTWVLWHLKYLTNSRKPTHLICDCKYVSIGSVMRRKCAPFWASSVQQHTFVSNRDGAVEVLFFHHPGCVIYLICDTAETIAAHFECCGSE